MTVKELEAALQAARDEYDLLHREILAKEAERLKVREKIRKLRADIANTKREAILAKKVSIGAIIGDKDKLTKEEVERLVRLIKGGEGDEGSETAVRHAGVPTGEEAPRTDNC